MYLVLLGGRHAKARLEVHDVVFVVADQLTDAYPQLRRSWFGSAEHLHIDGWLAIEQVEGYQVTVSTTPAAGQPLKLFFIHHGGYLSNRFGEEHQYCLVVAKDKTSAKQQAKQYLPPEWDKPHTDHLELLDDVSEVTIAGGQHFITLHKADTPVSNVWQNSYIVLS